MMLMIEATKNTPRVAYAPENQTLVMSGESYPENSFEFYQPVFDWLHTQLPKLDRLVLKIAVSYMNSSSTKCILDILDLLTEAGQQGAAVHVLWYYDLGNPRALDLAEEFGEDMEIPFEIIGVADTSSLK
jgi:hypothetical protein